MFEKYRITEDSFGSVCPKNWEEVADYLNDKIARRFDELERDNADSDEYRYEADAIWENYCNGEYDAEI